MSFFCQCSRLGELLGLGLSLGFSVKDRLERSHCLTFPLLSRTEPAVFMFMQHENRRLNLKITVTVKAAAL